MGSSSNSSSITSRPLRASALPLLAGTAGVARFAVQDSRLLKTAAVRIACDSTKTASLPPSRPRHRPLCLRTRYGAALGSLRQCTAHMASLFLLLATQRHMASRRVSSSSICQAPLQQILLRPMRLAHHLPSHTTPHNPHDKARLRAPIVMNRAVRLPRPIPKRRRHRVPLLPPITLRHHNPAVSYSRLLLHRAVMAEHPLRLHPRRLRAGLACASMILLRIMEMDARRLIRPC